jgi:hypothetical protein
MCTPIYVRALVSSPVSSENGAKGGTSARRRWASAVKTIHATTRVLALGSAHWRSEIPTA